jgi:hypothetical protein
MERSEIRERHSRILLRFMWASIIISQGKAPPALLFDWRGHARVEGEGNDAPKDAGHS